MIIWYPRERNKKIGRTKAIWIDEIRGMMEEMECMEKGLEIEKTGYRS